MKEKRISFLLLLLLLLLLLNVWRFSNWIINKCWDLIRFRIIGFPKFNAIILMHVGMDEVRFAQISYFCFSFSDNSIFTIESLISPFMVIQQWQGWM